MFSYLYFTSFYSLFIHDLTIFKPQTKTLFFVTNQLKWVLKGGAWTRNAMNLPSKYYVFLLLQLWPLLLLYVMMATTR